MSEIRVGFEGGGAGAGELTWGQSAIWRAIQRTGRTMNLTVMRPLPAGSAVTEMVSLLRFVVSRHPGLRTRLRWPGGPSGGRPPQQVIAASGEVPLEVADIGGGDDPAAAAEELRSRYELTPFDYENEFPVRMAVLRQSGTPVYLVVGYCHVMVDGPGLGALAQDLANLDPVTGEATSPPPDLNTLALARVQGSPAGRRQSERCMQYWAAQLARVPAWRPSETVTPQDPRFWELAAYSPALELGMRAVSARTASPRCPDGRRSWRGCPPPSWNSGRTRTSSHSARPKPSCGKWKRSWWRRRSARGRPQLAGDKGYGTEYDHRL